MAYNQNPHSYKRWAVLLVVTLAVLALVFWWMGAFHSAPKNTREVYKAGVTDQSGGSFIVTDTSTPGVKVTVPTVRMTNVPATPKPSPSATPAAK